VFNDVIWEKFEGHLHVLISIKRRFEIHVFDIGATEFGSRRTDYTVSHYFGRDHIGCSCCQFVCIINKVAANCDPYSIWVVFLGAVGDNDSCVRDRPIFRDASDLFVREIENRVCADRYTFFSLCKAVQLL
jgi:hypothetical protein